MDVFIFLTGYGAGSGLSKILLGGYYLSDEGVVWIFRLDLEMNLGIDVMDNIAKYLKIL